MEVERSSLCNCVVNFLLEEKYLLTAFELLHELIEDGRDDHAIRLKEFFGDRSHFPPDQISRFNSLQVADPQSLLEEKESMKEKLALSEYEQRLAQEDIAKLKAELEKRAVFPPADSGISPNQDSTIDVASNSPAFLSTGKETSSTDLGPLKDYERRDINCALKEYLLLAGYRLTAMTFYEEVSDQDMDAWQNSSGCVPDALRQFYYHYLSSTNEAAEEKIAMLQENDSLRVENKALNDKVMKLQKLKDEADDEIVGLSRSLDALQKELKDRDKQVQDVKLSWECQRNELNACRSEITALKIDIAGSRSKTNSLASDVDVQTISGIGKHQEGITSLLTEVKPLATSEKDSVQSEDKAFKISDLISREDIDAVPGFESILLAVADSKLRHETLDSLNKNVSVEKSLTNGLLEPVDSIPPDNNPPKLSTDKLCNAAMVENMGLDTIQILADALPKIVPYVLINHREELLPLIMCAIERHPNSSTRDSLTHTLFNLIKRPDGQQRRIIMDACVTLARNVGEMRTETELLPQCWEQINHMYEERRLLVAQSCGELAGFVRPEIRDSLILSIVQQLIEDSATVVREAAAHNLALLLPLFPNVEKYFKVEEILFQLVCDPSGIVLETTLNKLLPEVIKWGKNLDHVLKVLLSQIASSTQRCSPLSGVEGSLESNLLVLGERERWNIDVLLRMLLELVPFIHQKVVGTCPVPSASDSPEVTVLPMSSLQLYAGGSADWAAFEWLHADCFPDLIHLACTLPSKEDNIRSKITKFLLAICKHFGDSYVDNIMLPVFLKAVGGDSDLLMFPPDIQSIIKGLKPKSGLGEKLATMCVLPLLLAGVLGTPSKREQLSSYLRKLLVDCNDTGNQSTKHTFEIIQAIRFLCIFEDHHTVIFTLLWEMVASSDADLKVNAATVLKVIVPYVDVKVASTHILPALITLGSDQNLKVKYASIDAFGSVAQHFKNDAIVDKIRVQMDAFLEDGSHEATVAVMRALLLAVPHTTDKLRDYILSKILLLTATPPPLTDLARRRERADTFCETIRALDATEISVSSVRDFLLPAVQNLLKDADALDPAHKEALEAISRERSGGTFDALSKVMGAHLGLATSVTSFFGEGGRLNKKEALDPSPAPPVPNSPVLAPPQPAEDTRFMRIMKGNFSDMLRSKAKTTDELH